MGKCCSKETDYLLQSSSKPRDSKQARNSHYSFASILESSGSDSQAVYKHPICLSHSIRAYEVHTFFEEALGITFIPDSIKLKPHLKLIEPYQEKEQYHEIFIAVTVHQYLQDTEPYKSNKQEILKLLTKIDESLKNLLKKKPTFLKDKEEVIAEILFFTLMNFSEELIDINPMILDSNDAPDDLLERAFRKLSSQKIEATLTPIFTTFAKIQSQSIRKSHINLIISSTLSSILAADPRAIDILVNHPYFLPKLDNHESIFGACINFTCFSDESQYVIIDDSQPKDEQQKLLRESRNQVMNQLYDSTMQFMIKANSKYEKDIAKWLTSMLEFFETKFKGDLSEMMNYKGLFLNYLSLLFKFLQEPLKKFEDYNSLANQIDLTYLQQFSLATDQPLLNGKTHELLAHCPSSSNNSFSFQTQLVFIACHAIGQYENFVRKYLENNKNMFSVAAVGFISMMTSEDPASFGFLTQALEDNLINQIFKLISLQVLLILRSFDRNLTDHTIPDYFDSIENQSSSLPVYWLENMVNCLSFLRKASSITFIVSQQQLGLIVNFFFSVLQRKELFKHSTITSSCLSFLSSLIPATNNSLQLLPTQFIADFFIKATKTLLPSLVQCFVDVEKTPEKYSARVDCCYIISGLLRKENNTAIATAILDEISQTQNELCQKFVTYYLNDLMQLFEGLKKMNKVIEVEQRLADGADGFDLADLLVLLLDRDGVKGAIEYLKVYLLLGSHMSKCSPSFFLSDETKDKLALTLNFMLNEFLGKNAELPVQPIQNFNYVPALFLKKILSLSLNFKDQKEFLREVVSDEQNFSVEFFKSIEGISKLLGLLDSEQMTAWKKLVEDLEKTKIEKENEEKWMTEIQDVPEEYLDTLMNTVMKEPVMLPTSKVILDKTTIRKHLLTDPTDPFNRNPLTFEMLIPQPELKQKIQEFVHVEKSKNRGC